MRLETDRGTDRTMKEYKSYPEPSTSAQLKGSLTSLQNTPEYNLNFVTTITIKLMNTDCDLGGKDKYESFMLG